jgi:hypothetical protein
LRGWKEEVTATPGDDEALVEPRQILEELRAVRWLDRVKAAVIARG